MAKHIYITYDQNGYITGVGVTSETDKRILEARHGRVSLHTTTEPDINKVRIRLQMSLKANRTKAFTDFLGYTPMLSTEPAPRPLPDGVRRKAAIFGESDQNYFVEFKYDPVFGFQAIRAKS